MLRLLAIVIIAALATGCGKPEKDSQADAPAKQATEATATESALSGQRELTDLNAGHPELEAAQKIGGAEGRSPFEGDRVIKLNAIVRRSLDVSREFDKAAPGIRAAVDAAAAGGDRAAAEAGLKTISDYYDRAKSALDDMVKAEAELKASGEYYDDSIFYGMMKFVTDIETELREEKAALQAKLG
jgi:hypothetical protein